MGMVKSFLEEDIKILKYVDRCKLPGVAEMFPEEPDSKKADP